MEKQDEREAYIEYAKTHLCDLISKEDPDYEVKLQMIAEQYADYEINGYPDEYYEELRKHTENLPEFFDDSDIPF